MSYSTSTRLLRAVGDCNTLGAGELSPEDCLPAQVLKRLRQSGARWELENLGAAMNTSREGVARVRDAVRPADLLLINYGLVDAWVTAMPWVYVYYYPETQWRKWSRKVLKFVKRRLRSPWIRRIVGRGTVVTKEEFRRNLQTIITRERQRNPEVNIVLWSCVMTRDKPARDAQLTQYNEVIETLSREMGTGYFDAATCVQQLPHQEIYLDEVHLTGSAAAFLAESLVKQLAMNQSTSRAA